MLLPIWGHTGTSQPYTLLPYLPTEHTRRNEMVRYREPPEGTADMLMARSSAVRRRLANNPKVTVDYIEASGDCFYLAMEAALCERHGWRPVYAVSTMRDVVATSLTEEVYELYALLHTQNAEGENTCPTIEA